MTYTQLPVPPDYSSFLTFAAPALIVIAIFLVLMLAIGGKKPNAPKEASAGEAELLSEIRELKRRRVLDRGV